MSLLASGNAKKESKKEQRKKKKKEEKYMPQKSALSKKNAAPQSSPSIHKSQESDISISANTLQVSEAKPFPRPAYLIERESLASTPIKDDDDEDEGEVDGDGDGDGDGNADGEDKEKGEAENEVDMDNETVTYMDSLTGIPVEDDILLYAIPVCAPYQALVNFKYKVKLTPGSLKKGKGK